MERNLRHSANNAYHPISATKTHSRVQIETRARQRSISAPQTRATLYVSLTQLAQQQAACQGYFRPLAAPLENNPQCKRIA